MINISQIKLRIKIFNDIFVYDAKRIILNTHVIVKLYQNSNNDISIIEEFDQWFNFKNIIDHYTVKEDVLEKYFDRLDINVISKFHNLSSEFIKKFHNYLDFSLLSKYCILKDDIIDEFSYKIDFNYLSYYNKISLYIAKKYIDKLQRRHILDNPNTDKEVYDFVYQSLNYKKSFKNVYTK
jgi:hypothetical protein